MAKEAEVASGMGVPSLNHWKEKGGVPEGSTVKAKGWPSMTLRDWGGKLRLGGLWGVRG